jgi:hypothetical protein
VGNRQQDVDTSVGISLLALTPLLVTRLDLGQLNPN